MPSTSGLSLILETSTCGASSLRKEMEIQQEKEGKTEDFVSDSELHTIDNADKSDQINLHQPFFVLLQQIMQLTTLHY